MISLKKNLVENDCHSFLAPPPFKKIMPCIAKPQSDALKPLADTELKETFDAIQQAILTYKIGGKFWEKPLARPFRAILSLPEHCELSTAQAALNCLTRTFSQSDILLLTPSLTHKARKLARNLKLSCAGADTLDPHSLTETVTAIIAVTPRTFQLDVCILASLHGISVALWDTQAKPVETLSATRALSIIFQKTQYFSPFTGQETDCLSVIELLALWKHTLLANRQIGACMGMSLWKRPQMSAFLAKAPGQPKFFQSPSRAIAACKRLGEFKIAIWATRLPTGIKAALEKANLHLVLVEDGFVRSIGLGSALQPPASIFLDTRGVYYDPAEASDLEHILATYHFNPSLLARAHTVLERLRTKGISKYGRATNAAAYTTARHSRSQLRLLVPGQVADDLSVLRGGGEIQDNFSLLKAVRAAHPDAYIIYRPHPDVEGGYRKGSLPDQEVLTLANEVSSGGNITELLAQVDEVHTLTSLAGFEALIRNIPVTTYGTPFYAGWSLTKDKGAITPRRNRVLSLTELVAGTLLIYPRYLDPVTRLPCPLETVLDRFEQPDVWRQTYWMRLRGLQIRLHKKLFTLCPQLLFFYR